MIKRITHKDKDIYFELANEFYNSDAVIKPVPQHYFENTFQEMMRSNVYAEGFLLMADGTVQGYALIAKTFSQEAGGLAVWIEELYVREKYRSRGLGSEFFEFVQREIPAARYRLEVEPENERAVALYRRKGFEVLPYRQMVSQSIQTRTSLKGRF